MLPFELFISFRYLLAKRKEKFISIITFLSVGGVALSVMTLIIVIAVMTGFEKDMKEKILGASAQVTISADAPVSGPYKLVDLAMAQKHVTAAAPYVFGQVILKIRNRVIGVVARGIDVEREKTVTNLSRKITAGTYDLGDNDVLIGEEMAKRFGLMTGDRIRIISPSTVMTPLGPASRIIDCTIKGFFNYGMYEYDSNLVYLNLKTAQKLYGLGGDVHGVSIKLDRVENAEIVKQELMSQLRPPLYAYSWIDQNRNLFAALKTEKNVMFILLVLAIAVAATNIISTLIMMVMEKTKDIGIMKSIGVSSRGVMGIFLLVGLTIGIVGTLIGAAGGALFVAKIGTIEALVSKVTGVDVFPREIYYLDKLPATINGSDLTTICLCAVVLAILAAVYPAWRASRLNPVEALRYE
ncbi:MAG TPA: lipoprotein-releasing ABC transporter permease subunit [bacterium]|nr:lipoprotein-releasing ABC transporter permease subunit [bacterium]